MTSLDPSHFAALGVGSSNDRTHGGATHAVRLDDDGRMATSSPGSQIDSDEAALPSPTSSFFDRRKELPHRLSSLQLPDLRFEQGYLMSLMPFFHFRPSSPPPPKKPSNIPHNPSQPSFVFGHHRSVSGSSDVSLSEADIYYLGSNFYVEWKMVIYVTLRDQLFYPLIQGCLWGSAAPLISHLWRLRPSRKRAPPRTSSTLPSPAPIATTPTTLWDRFVGSIWGGIQTNVAL